MGSLTHLGAFPFCVQYYPVGIVDDGGNVSLFSGQVELDDPRLELFSTGNGTLWPVKMPLAAATKMWWVAKHWKVSYNYDHFIDLEGDYAAGSFNRINSPTSFQHFSNDLANANNFSYVSQVGDEREIPCFVAFNNAFAGRSFVWNTTVEREVYLSGPGSIQSSPGGGFPYQSIFEDVVQFRLGFGAGIQAFDLFPPFANSEEDGQLYCAFSAELDTTFDLWKSQAPQVLGQEEPSLLKIGSDEFAFGIFDQGPYPASTMSLTNLVIEPLEYWPYDDGTGPFWDTATGAQLKQTTIT